MTARKNAVAQTAIAATNAENKARSFLRSVRDLSHQPSYVRMLVMVPSPPPKYDTQSAVAVIAITQLAVECA
jgi:hypothetical protein